jgi:hypothetical protein
MAVSALWHHPLAATLNRTKQLLDMHWISLKKWVTAQNWAQIAMKDAVSASVIRRKNADRS